jgi:hypothetical protein
MREYNRYQNKKIKRRTTMKNCNWSVKRSVLCAITLLIVVGCAQEQAAIRPQPSAAVASAVTPVAETERDAKKILMSMAEFLSKNPRFSVNLTNSYEVLQESGQKIEFGESRKIGKKLPVKPHHPVGLITYFRYFAGDACI